MAAFSDYEYNATTSATAGLYLLDFGTCDGTFISVPEYGWYYGGKGYKSKKLALVAKNKDLSLCQTLLMRADAPRPVRKRKKALLGKCHIKLRPRTTQSRRQIDVQKRKTRLHKG